MQRTKRLMRFKQRGKPPVYPAFMHVRIDPLNRIWISPFSLQRLSWLVIDNDGSRLSTVTLPYPASARPELTGFADGSVIIRYFDEDGAVHYALHRVE
jgi:hypothetical protein